jgi:prolyl oligopeptidase
MKKILFYTAVSCFPLGVLNAQSPVVYPSAAKENVSDTYFNVKVEDPYRWLENTESPRTQEWVKDENTLTQNYFKNIRQTEKLKQRLTQLWNFNKMSAPFKKGNAFFSFKNNGLQNQSVMYIHKSVKDEGSVLLDPNTLSIDGTVSLSGTSVSRDGKILAYGISKAGSDWVEIHFRDIATKKDLPDVINWVKFSSMSWKGNGIYYSRYDEPKGGTYTGKNEFHKVYYHVVGTKQEKDMLVHEDKAHPDYNFGASVTDDGNYLVLTTTKSTSGNSLQIKDLTNPKASFVTLESSFDYEMDVVENVGNVFYVLTTKEAPMYQLKKLSLAEPEYKNWKTVIPEDKFLLQGVTFCNNEIIVHHLVRAVSQLHVHDLDGKYLHAIELPNLCKVSSINSDIKDNFATYSTVQYTAPEKVFYYDAKTKESSLLFKPNSGFSSENFITEQVSYPSKDGTPISMFITHRKDLAINENTPCFVFGYGGFNISLGPEFRIDRALFLEAGGIYCVPNLRGGGEYGEDWHKQGTKCLKQNVFDDFIAACDYLVSKKMTSYSKIAIHGRSNGGLLIGAVMTQRPDICKVAIPTVGVLDMLRFHLFTIGRAWTVDYGCSENAQDFYCLHKYSPLHNVREKEYPATLVLTGDHDDRVVPAHSYKFTATLQEKQKGKEPILIRIDSNAGHGSGKPTAKQIEEFADMWSYVFYHLKMEI